jgi:hypothetical protein
MWRTALKSTKERGLGVGNKLPHMACWGENQGQREIGNAMGVCVHPQAPPVTGFGFPTVEDDEVWITELVFLIREVLGIRQGERTAMGVRRWALGVRRWALGG